LLRTGSLPADLSLDRGLDLQLFRLRRSRPFPARLARSLDEPLRPRRRQRPGRGQLMGSAGRVVSDVQPARRLIVGQALSPARAFYQMRLFRYLTVPSLLIAATGTFDQALNLYYQTEFDKAIAILTQLPSSGRMQTLLGECYYLTANYVKATQALEAA